MCGIAGSFSQNSSTEPSGRMQSALHALHHRGPNDQGLAEFHFNHNHLFLGQTRLSIIDLSHAGHQPMYSRDSRFCIVFNGEIYNYKELRQTLKNTGYAFHTESDTEVLLQAWIHWGEACLRKLVGMFAFAVYDQQMQTLTCARDAFGIKPFFYRHNSNSFSFASEIPALLCLLTERSTLNAQRAYDYLLFGQYDDQAATFLNGIQHLPPAHCLTLALKTNQAECRRWWWPDITERRDLGFSDAAAQLRERFLNNIRLHLRSDVPLGAALSGGLDSSAVVCAMRHLESDLPIHTFSYIARGSSVDEEKWVDVVNQHIQAIPHKVTVEPAELADDLDDMLKVQGEPFGSTSIYAQYRVFKLAREHGIIVTLDGQGADELLAGYSGYPGQRMMSLLEQGRVLECLQFCREWSKWPDRSLVKGGMLLAQAVLPATWQSVPRKLVGHNPLPVWIDKARLNGLSVVPWQGVENARPDAVKGRHLMAALRHTLSGGNLSNLLRHGDRNAMRWSIESRVPFLTLDMAEFLLSLPEHYLIGRNGETKHIFRAAMRGIVPDAILDRRDKIGFATPEKHLLANLAERIPEWLQGLDRITFIQSEAAKQEVAAILQGKKPFNYQAWRLINLGRWVAQIRL
jgi:asparagine synthase (glutamine-hydrolysing)